MIQISYILLCHKNPQGVIQQARSLTEHGDRISIHVDQNAPDTVWREISEGLADDSNVTFAKRLKCGWGEWSLVEATLNALNAARSAFPETTHFYFISGDCMPVKSRRYIVQFLEQNDVDFVEHNDFFKSDWIKTGIKEDRLHYRHFFNERKNKPLFYKSLNFQRKFGLKRSVPAGLDMYIGSQWCVLRRGTVDKIFKLIRERKDILKFFKTTWIPDETFFQSLVMHVVPRTQVRSRTLTFLAFSDYGMPVNFHDDHFDLICAQDNLFARKISENALVLRDRLRRLYGGDDISENTANTAHALYSYVTGRGRIGRRYEHRFWEKGGQIGRGQEIFVVVCKKYHVGKRFVTAISRIGGIASLGYVFDEDADVLPALGGIESSREKRGRHRRAVLRMLFEYHDTNRLLICVDPSNIDTLRDINHDPCTMRVLEIRTDVDLDYLHGHAQRTGLLPEGQDVHQVEPLLRTVERQFRDEREAVRDLNLAQFYSVGPGDRREDACDEIARFMSMSSEKCRDIIQNDDFYN